jgi:TonB family protein
VSETIRATSPLKAPIVKSTIIHVCIIVLFFTAPGFNIFKEKEPPTIWVDLPYGPGESPADAFKPKPEVIKEDTEQKTMEPEQKPLLEPTKESVIEKSVVAKARSKPVPRQKRVSLTDRKISDALASIDKTLQDRGAPPPDTYGYKYGTGTEPVRISPTDPMYIKYQALVRIKIVRNWVVPEGFASAGASANAELIVMINTEGEVSSVRWAKRSGSEAFDESAKRAVEKSSPLPKPPEKLAWETYNEGFLISFDARVR